MADERDLNTGVLFNNDNKDPNDPTHAKRPDKTGHFTDSSGVRRQFAGWLRKGKSGQMFLSVTVGEPMRESTAAPREPRPAQQRNSGGYSAREQQVSAPRYGSRPPQDFREQEVDFDPNDVPFE